jgi:hypothetical protein
MSFKVELDKESGKYKIFNGKKKEYSKRMFKSKESATKVANIYSNFGKKPTSSSEDMPPPKPKTKRVRKKAVHVEEE